MWKKLLIFSIFSINICFAQNLLLNPSLEEYSNCPNIYSQIQFADNWSAGCMANNTSTDYYHCCMINDPDPFWSHLINELHARSGCGFSGFFIYVNGDIFTNYREALTGKSRISLHQNTCYRVSFFIKFIGYHFVFSSNTLNYATNKISAYLSSDSIFYEGTGDTSLYQLHPQINYHGAVLSDTINWVKIEGSFIAQGNERWIHITSFVPDDSVTVYMLPNLINQIDSLLMPSYYLIDDVAVYPCDAPIYTADAGVKACVNIGNSVTIGTPRRDEYLYWWYDEQGSLLDTSAQITVSPTQTTTYHLVQKDFKFDETRDTVIVTVGNCPIPDYSHFDFEIYPNPCNGIVNVRFNTKVPEGAVLELYDMIGQEVGQYPLTGTENIATINLGNLATAVYHATVVVPDGFRKSVKLVVIR